MQQVEVQLTDAQQIAAERATELLTARAENSARHEEVSAAAEEVRKRSCRLFFAHTTGSLLSVVLSLTQCARNATTCSTVLFSLSVYNISGGVKQMCSNCFCTQTRSFLLLRSTCYTYHIVYLEALLLPYELVLHWSPSQHTKSHDT
jgi:predicted phage tail protein